MGQTGSKLNHSKWFGKNHRRVICVGPKGSGKSSITSYLTSKYSRAAKPLPEIGCYKFKIAKFIITFYDLKGDDQSRFFWRHHYEGSQGVIFVMDLSDENAYDQSKNVLKELMLDPLLKNRPFLIFGNKRDLRDVDITRIRDLLDIVPDRELEIVITCGVTGEGVVEGITWLLEKMNSV
jgi:ADP-ribosylation factor 1/2